MAPFRLCGAFIRPTQSFEYKEIWSLYFAKTNSFTRTFRGARMEWLNYHHLMYFWAVARYGSVVRASAELRLAQPTISGQIRLLESSLGVQLFDRVGRNLVLTNAGRTTFRHADEIFSIGKELVSAL